VNEFDQLAAPLTAVVQAAGFEDSTVTVAGAASVGANRSTMFVDIVQSATGATTEAVAQVGTIDESKGTAQDEALLMELAAAQGVPVPTVIATADELNGEPVNVLITGRVPGLGIPRKILRSIPNDESGDGLAHACGDALARIHAVSVGDVPDVFRRLDQHRPHEDYCGLLDEQLSELPTFHPATRWALNHLRRNPPSRPERMALVHGDFRNGNLLVEEGKLAAVLDWELAHVGDPMEDLAWMCVRMWRFGNDERLCGGFGSVDALRQGYESAGGVWRDDAFHWWLAARSAWWAIGLASQAAAFVSGESTSIVHAASGRRVPELEYDLVTLIRQAQQA